MSYGFRGAIVGLGVAVMTVVLIFLEIAPLGAFPFVRSYIYQIESPSTSVLESRLDFLCPLGALKECGVVFFGFAFTFDLVLYMLLGAMIGYGYEQARNRLGT